MELKSELYSAIFLSKNKFYMNRISVVFCIQGRGQHCIPIGSARKAFFRQKARGTLTGK